MTEFLKRLLLFLFLTFIIQVSYSQKLDWVKTFGDSLYDGGICLSYDTSSKIVLAGLFSNSLTYQVDSTSYSLQTTSTETIFLMKLDKNGNTVWARSTGLHATPVKVMVDSRNNIFIVGKFTGIINIPSIPFIQSNGGYDIFFCKLSPEGNMIWIKTFGSTADESATAHIDNNDHIYISGRYLNTVNFSTDTPGFIRQSNGKSDIYTSKWENNGKIIWLQTGGGNENEMITTSISDENQNIYLGGYFRNSINLTFNNTNSYLNGNNYGNLFIIKLDSLGNLKWSKTINGSWECNLSEIVLDFKGGIFLTGVFKDSLTFVNDNERQNCVGGNCGFIANLKLDGTFSWSKTIESTHRLSIESAIADSNSNLFIAGSHYGRTDFDPGPCVEEKISLSPTNIILGKYDSLGNLINSIAFERISSPQIITNATLDILPIEDGVINTGGYSGQTDFDADTGTQYRQSNGNSDVFINKISFCQKQGTSSTLTICKGDTVLLGCKIISQEGVYKEVIKLSNGCDSINQISVIITPSSTDTVVYELCKGDSLTLFNDVHKKDTVIKKIFQNSFGCDSTIVRKLIFHETASKTFYFEICEGESIQIGSNFYSKSGIFQDTLLNQYGCDSLVHTTLLVKQVDTTFQQINLCENDTFYVGTSAYTKAGIFLDTLVGKNSCDSLVYTQISINKNAEYTQTISLCKGESFQIGDSIYTQAGIYENIFVTKNGCDSIVRTQILKNDLTLFHSPQENLISLLISNQSYQWLNCDSMRTLLNDTLQNFSYTQNGNYAVVLQSAACSDTSDCIQVNYYEEFEFKLYPNPSKNYCKIEVPSSGQLRIFDLRGALLKNITYSNPGKYHLELHQFAAGIYLIEFEGELKKVVKQLAVIK